MSALISQRARQFVGLGLQFVQKVSAVLREAAATEQSDPNSAWKANFQPFCQVTTAGGAKWACDGHGNWYLIEANSIPLEASVAELLEQFGMPAGASLDDVEQQALIARRAHNLAAFYRLGLALPMEYLQRTYAAKDTNSKCDSPCRAKNQRTKTKCADCHKAGQDACGLGGSFKCATDGGADSVFIHGGSSVGVGLVGADHATRELSPRLYRGGDHA